MDDLVGEFISETSESLAALERALADHARTPMTRDGWDMAYRLMHTIKGTCGFLGFTNMERVADRSEQLLAHARDHALTPSATELSDIRSAMAQISVMMEHLAKHGSEPAVAPPPAPTPEAPPEPRASLDHVNAQIHHPTPEVNLPPVIEPAPSTALTHRVDEPREQVGFGTLATLVTLRNQLRDIARGRVDARISAATTTLDTLIADLKQKLQPRPKHQPAGPRIARALLVESAGQRFGLAQAAVREVMRIDPTERLANLPQGAMISLHGSWVPRVSLSERLGHGNAAQEAYAVLLEIGEARVALCVEHLGELEELVVQPVPKLLRSKPLYDGATILGDGTPCLLIDAAALLTHQPRAMPHQPIARSAPAPVVVEAPAPIEAEEEELPAIAVKTATPFLLFSDGTHQPKAMPLQHVARVEHVQAADVALKPEGYQFLCRGQLLHLKLLPGCTMPAQGDFPVIMLLESPQTGVVASRMHGIIDAPISLPQAQGRDAILTRTVIDNTLTDVVNPNYFLEEAVHA